MLAAGFPGSALSGRLPGFLTSFSREVFLCPNGRPGPAKARKFHRNGAQKNTKGKKALPRRKKRAQKQPQS
jgi:hypothetical protein